MERVILDTSVLLTGPFRPKSWAAHLGEAKNECTFVVTEYVLSECKHMLRAAADSALTLRAADATVMQFIRELGAVVVPDTIVRSTRTSADAKDQPIVDAAVAHDCTVICTYNLADFGSVGVRSASPLGLLKQLTIRPDWWAVQIPVLGERGTILAVGHISSLGTILESDDGTTICERDDAMIVAEGPGARRFVPKLPLPRDKLVGFMLRYRESGDCEAAYWRLSNSGSEFTVDGTKVILTQGKVHLSNPLPRMMFNGNWGFFAAIINLSGIPSYVPDKAVPHVMRDSCLEGLCGAADIRAAMRRREIIRGPSGELLVAFPS